MSAASIGQDIHNTAPAEGDLELILGDLEAAAALAAALYEAVADDTVPERNPHEVIFDALFD